MAKLQLILTIGAPRSGKDTWADQFIASQTVPSVWVKVNRDWIRRELFGFSKWSEYKFSKEKEKVVTEVQFVQMDEAKKDGKNIICSDTNINPKTRQRFEEWANENGYEVTHQHFDVPLHILEQRNADAPYGVAPSVLIEMWQNYNAQFGEQYVPNEELESAVIFDVDGTLANHNGIRSSYDWSRVFYDEPRKNVVQLAQLLFPTNKIIIMSGRDGSCREDTIKWLSKHNIPYDMLLMRTAGDMRKDYIIKKELFDTVRNKYNVKLAVDDRNSIVNLWRSMGIECWQVNYGAF